MEFNSQTSLIWTPKGQNQVSALIYRGVRIIEVGNVWYLAFLGPNDLSARERCPYHRGVRKERLRLYITKTCFNCQLHSWSFEFQPTETYKTGFHCYVLRQIKIAVFVHIWLNVQIQFCVILSSLVSLSFFIFS